MKMFKHWVAKTTVVMLAVLFLLGNLVLISPESVYADDEKTEETTEVADTGGVATDPAEPEEGSESTIPPEDSELTDPEPEDPEDPTEAPADVADETEPEKPLEQEPSNTRGLNEDAGGETETQSRDVSPNSIIDPGTQLVNYIYYANGSKVAQQTLKVGEKLLEPKMPESPDSKHYFVGWYIANEDMTPTEQQPNFGNPVTVEQGDPNPKTVNVVAVFASKYILNYYQEGSLVHSASLDPNATNVFTEEMLSDAYLTPIDGKVFIAWVWYKDGDPNNTDPENMEILFAGHEITSSMEIHARFENGYLITFNSHGGTSFKPEIVVGTKTPELTQHDPEKTGYEFDGWYYDEEYNESYEADQEINSDITLHAKWKAQSVPYEIVFMMEKANEDGYEYGETETRYAYTGTQITENMLPLNEFPVGFSYSHHEELDSKTVAGDGSTQVKVYRWCNNFVGR